MLSNVIKIICCSKFLLFLGLHRYVFVLLEQTRPITIATEAEKAAMLEKTITPKSQKSLESNKKSDSLGARDRSKSPVRPKSSAPKSSSGLTETKGKEEKEKLLGSSVPEKNPLIQCVKFSTKEFTKKYAIFGILAANFFQVNLIANLKSKFY